MSTARSLQWYACKIVRPLHVAVGIFATGFEVSPCGVVACQAKLMGQQLQLPAIRGHHKAANHTMMEGIDAELALKDRISSRNLSVAKACTRLQRLVHGKGLQSFNGKTFASHGSCPLMLHGG
eukprot:5276356-Amphidinium_carterae.1